MEHKTNPRCAMKRPLNKCTSQRPATQQPVTQQPATQQQTRHHVRCISIVKMRVLLALQSRQTIGQYSLIAVLSFQFFL